MMGYFLAGGVPFSDDETPYLPTLLAPSGAFLCGLRCLWMDLLKDIALWIVGAEIVALVVAWVVLFRLENCFRYALREFRAGTLYLVIRWSHARWRRFRVPHVLVMDRDKTLRHWQPHIWKEKWKWWEVIHHPGKEKIGDE